MNVQNIFARLISAMKEAWNDDQIVRLQKASRAPALSLVVMEVTLGAWAWQHTGLYPDRILQDIHWLLYLAAFTAILCSYNRGKDNEVVCNFMQDICSGVTAGSAGLYICTSLPLYDLGLQNGSPQAIYNYATAVLLFVFGLYFFVGSKGRS